MADPMTAAREAWLERLHHEHEMSPCAICGIPSNKMVQYAFDAGWTAAMAQPNVVLIVDRGRGKPAPFDADAELDR